MSKPKHTVHLKNLGTPRQSHVASATTPRQKIELRKSIEEQTERFLEAGGEIQKPDLQDRTKRHKARFNAGLSDVSL